MNNSLQLWDGNLSLITRPVPHVSSPNEVIIKVAFSGICEMDQRILVGELPVSRCVVPGHEFAGVVSEVGAEVRNVSIGDRVVINPHVSCNTCPACTRGQTHFCEPGYQSFIGIYRNGGWSQYTRVQANNVHILPPQTTLRHAVLSEPISCILHGLDTLKPLATDSKILVNGCGFAGILWICILHFHGYRKVVVCEQSDKRRLLATGLRLGYDVTHPDTIDAEAYEGLRLDKHWGFDAVIDCTSSCITTQKAAKWMKNGGKILLCGCYPQHVEFKISPYEILNKELKIFGSYSNPFKFPQALQLLRDMTENYLDFSKLGILLFQLSKYEDAFAALSNEKVLKVIFET